MKTPQVCRPHPSLLSQISVTGGDHHEKSSGQKFLKQLFNVLRHKKMTDVLKSLNGKQDHLILGREILCPIVQVQSWMKCLRWSYCLLRLRAQGSWTFPKLGARGTKIVVKRPKVSNFSMDPTLRSIIGNPDPGKRYPHLQDYSGVVKMTDDLLL